MPEGHRTNNMAHRILDPKHMAFPYTVPAGWLAVVDTSATIGRMAIMPKGLHLDKGYRLIGETGDWMVCFDFFFQTEADLGRSINRVRKASGLTV